METKTAAEETTAPAHRARLARLFWWTIYALAFGLTEAILVVYVRKLLNIAPGEDYADWFSRRGVALNSATFTQEFAGRGLLRIEQAREVGTIALLAGAALASGRTWREIWAIFLWTFAVWDMSYYGYLVALIGFPRGLTAVDVYFLVPISWYGPTWFPLCVVMPSLLVLALWLFNGRQDKPGVLQ